MRHPRTRLLTAALLVTAALAQLPPSPQMAADAAAIIQRATTGGENATAWTRLAEATDTFGPRMSGSQPLNDFIAWVAATAAKTDGLQVTLEPVMVPRWVRGAEWARMESPRNKSLHFVGLGYSNGTAGRVVTAPVLVVGTQQELLNRSAEAVGKIVLFDWLVWEGYGTTVNYRYSAATWAASVGAVGALIKSIAPYGLQTAHTGASDPAGVAAGAVSREDSMQMRRMQERGQSVVVSMYMEATLLAPAPSFNVIMDYTSPGAAFPEEYVIVSGHVDSWDIAEGAMVREYGGVLVSVTREGEFLLGSTRCCAASFFAPQDDGGGFFTAWEAVRLIASMKLFSNRTIRAIGWVDEESGGAGAAQYAIDYASTFSNTSFAMESDTGAFAIYGLSVTANGAALAQLRALAPLLAPLGSGLGVELGGDDTDEDFLCSKVRE